MRDLPKDAEAEITFLPTEHGGRSSAVRSGYRGQFYYGGHDWDAIQSFPDTQEVCPGETARAYVAFLSPANMLDGSNRERSSLCARVTGWWAMAGSRA